MLDQLVVKYTKKYLNPEPVIISQCLVATFRNSSCLLLNCLSICARRVSRITANDRATSGASAARGAVIPPGISAFARGPRITDGIPRLPPPPGNALLDTVPADPRVPTLPACDVSLPPARLLFATLILACEELFAVIRRLPLVTRLPRVLCALVLLFDAREPLKFDSDP